ncbi:hypothetical protein D3C84_427620 [compost metagenome]
MHGHATGVGLQKRAQGRTTDDQDLKRLNQCCNLAVREDISAEHTREYDDDADNFSHGLEALEKSWSGSVRRFLNLFFYLSAVLRQTIAS